MLKPYTRQQIQTDKILSSINNIHDRNTVEQILTHKDILYNIIPNTKCYISLSSMITNTDSVVIIIYKGKEPVILDKYGGYMLNSLERMYVNTELFTICSDVSYIIETNYKGVHDAYTRLYMEWYKTAPIEWK